MTNAVRIVTIRLASPPPWTVFAKLPARIHHRFARARVTTEALCRSHIEQRQNGDERQDHAVHENPPEQLAQRAGGYIINRKM
jgi:hypothetical protein